MSKQHQNIASFNGLFHGVRQTGLTKAQDLWLREKQRLDKEEQSAERGIQDEKNYASLQRSLLSPNIRTSGLQDSQSVQDYRSRAKGLKRNYSLGSKPASLHTDKLSVSSSVTRDYVIL